MSPLGAALPVLLSYCPIVLQSYSPTVLQSYWPREVIAHTHMPFLATGAGGKQQGRTAICLQISRTCFALGARHSLHSSSFSLNFFCPSDRAARSFLTLAYRILFFGPSARWRHSWTQRGMGAPGEVGEVGEVGVELMERKGYDTPAQHLMESEESHGVIRSLSVDPPR